MQMMQPSSCITIIPYVFMRMVACHVPHLLKVERSICSIKCKTTLAITISGAQQIDNFTFSVLLFPDPPEISVETPVVYSGEGQEAMLVCIVHGEAQPEVSVFSVYKLGIASSRPP